MNPETTMLTTGEQVVNTLEMTTASPVLAKIPSATQNSLLRMFTDPHLLEKPERAELAEGLRQCVRANPDVSELRVLLGMALCVNFEVPDAIEELREGVRLAPNSFIANLKMGELWMRLRVIDKAAEHTRQAALLAQNLVQSQLARKQAATIRELDQNGIKRGGYTYKGSWHLVTSIRKLWKRDRDDALAVMETH
jgi:hypothetical protein